MHPEGHAAAFTSSGSVEDLAVFPGALENYEENTEAELLRVYISRMASR